MPIERFVWTVHAERRLDDRLLDRAELEEHIRRGHADRQINHGDADWLISGLLVDGRRFDVVYDHPDGDDHTAVRVISAWDYHGNPSKTGVL